MTESPLSRAPAWGGVRPWSGREAAPRAYEPPSRTDPAGAQKATGRTISSRDSDEQRKVRDRGSVEGQRVCGGPRAGVGPVRLTTHNLFFGVPSGCQPRNTSITPGLPLIHRSAGQSPVLGSPEHTILGAWPLGSRPYVDSRHDTHSEFALYTLAFLLRYMPVPKKARCLATLSLKRRFTAGSRMRRSPLCRHLSRFQTRHLQCGSWATPRLPATAWKTANTTCQVMQ